MEKMPHSTFDGIITVDADVWFADTLSEYTYFFTITINCILQAVTFVVRIWVFSSVISFLSLFYL